MKHNITTHIIGDDENDHRPFMAGGKVEAANALGDLKAEVMEGARIHIVESSTGYRLGMIEAIAMIDGKPCSAAKLSNEAIWDMVPHFMEAAKQAGLYHFAQAYDVQAAALFERLDSLPKIKAIGSLVA